MNTKKVYIAPKIEVIIVNEGKDVCLKTVSANAKGAGLAKKNSFDDFDDWDSDESDF